MPQGNSLGAHVQLLWETLSGNFGANIIEGLGLAAVGSSKSQQNMGSYCQTTIFFLKKEPKLVISKMNSGVVMPHNNKTAHT